MGDVQFHVGRKLALMIVRAQIVWTVFSLLGPSTTLLHRAKIADLFVDADQLVVELLETTELVNLPLRFA
jgi:hypothetical protein